MSDFLVFVGDVVFMSFDGLVLFMAIVLILILTIESTFCENSIVMNNKRSF